MKEGAFSDRLVASLTVTLAGTAHTIPAGNIKAFELDLWSWGLEGRVEFLVADEAASGGQQVDEVLADFLKPDLGEVSLELKTNYTDLATKPTPTHRRDNRTRTSCCANSLMRPI